MRVPNKLETDLGKEFYNSKMKQFLSKYHINHFSCHSPLKASVVERFNRTLKEKMWEYFSEVKHHCYVDVIDNLLSNYNNSYHRSIKMTPTEASKKENESEVRDIDRIIQQKYLRYVKLETQLLLLIEKKIITMK